jgi:glycosyltransferase involved in cell wall biosynthesis
LINATENIDSEVLIVGDGPYRKDLEKIAHKNVRFLGLKNKNEIRTILSKTKIFVNPSYSEGLPTSVLEAGAMGLAVVATDVGGTSEIINSKTGWLYKPKDVETLKKKITSILKNPKEKMKRSKKLRKHIVENFDWDKTAKKFMEVLK